MQRERPTAAAAPRDRLVGGAAGPMARRAVASEESCVRCNESQGVDKEPVPLTSGLTAGGARGGGRRECSGCPDRRSLSLREVFPLTKALSEAPRSASLLEPVTAMTGLAYQMGPFLQVGGVSGRRL